MQIILLKIENISWDGIIQAIAMLIVIFLALFLELIKKKIEKHRTEKEKLKELGYILKILITIPVQNTFFLENLFQKLTKFDENILQTIGLHLITTEESLSQFTHVNEYFKPKLPLLYCDSDINHPSIIAYPKFQNWNSQSNVYALPGSLTSEGGFSGQLVPIQENDERKRIWRSVKKQANTYGFKLEFKPNREERKSFRRNKKRSQKNYFELCKLIKNSLELILLKDIDWEKKFYDSFTNSEFDRILRDSYPQFQLKSEKGVFNLYFQTSKEGGILENTQEMYFRIAEYEFKSFDCFNKKNKNLLILARKEQLNIDTKKQLDDIDYEIIKKLSLISFNQQKFQKIFDRWIKMVDYCQVPRRYRKILPLKKRIYIRLKKHFKRLRNKNFSKAKE